MLITQVNKSFVFDDWCQYLLADYKYKCNKTTFVHRNLVRVTKSSQLQSVDSSQSNNATFLGKVGKDFEFLHLNCRVDIAECSANTGDDDNPADIKTLQEWILKL